MEKKTHGQFSWTGLLVIIIIVIFLHTWYNLNPLSFNNVMADIGFEQPAVGGVKK